MQFRTLNLLITCLLLARNAALAQQGLQVINEDAKRNNPAVFANGTPVYNAASVNYKRKEKIILTIRFEKPQVIGVAEKPLKWGFFQFPNIGRDQNGYLIAGWSMNHDAMEAYGKDGGYTATSADEGKSWQVTAGSRAPIADVVASNGDLLQITTPVPLPVAGVKLPKPLGTASENYRKSDFTHYRMKDVPQSVQGVYLKRREKGQAEWVTEHDSLFDPQHTRYSLAGKIPVVWWGDMRKAKDGSLIAGIYPGNWVKPDGSFDPKNNIFFYRSADNGKSWNVQGRLLYQADGKADSIGEKRMGFLEPGFEILKDGTFMCVMRTHDGAGMGPMYVSYSKDQGKNWSKPEAIAANGVLPRLLQLENGVVVLASGRPGVQLRFLASETNRKFSEPFEMLPYTDVNDMSASCGYTGLVATGKNSFLIIYSDFRFKTENGDERKAIKVRQVVVDRK